MLAGPIFSLETVTCVRRGRHFVMRALYASALLVAICGVYTSGTGYDRALTVHDLAELAAMFFQSFAWLQLLLVVGIGPALVAGIVAQERERRTIEYLFATDLSNAEIVLGKLSARLLLLIYLVLVGQPVLSIAMLMGGISPPRLLLVFLMTASTMLMVAGLSMLISVWTPRAREAVTRTYVTLIVLFVLPPVVQMWRGLLPIWLDEVLRPLVTAGLSVNPFWRLALLGQQDPVGFLGVLAAIGPLLASQLAVAGVSLGAAVWRVRQVHLHASGMRRITARFAWWPRFARPRIEHRPMLWKELFAERALPELGLAGRVAVLLIIAGVLVPIAIGFYTTSGSPYVQEFQHFATMLGSVVGCAGLLLIGARSASSITSEKERDTWSTLLSTPLVPVEIVAAKVLGNLYAARLVVYLLAVIWGLATLRDPNFAFGAAGSFAVMLLCGVCISLIGLLFSNWCSTSQRSMACTLGSSMFAGGGYLVCIVPIIGPGEPEKIILAPCVPFLVAWPAIAAVEPVRGQGQFMAPFILGVAGYSLATLSLWTAAVSHFDHLAGRTEARRDGAGVERAEQSGPDAV